jgi:allantoinase
VALSDRIPYQAQIDRPKLTLPGGKKLAVWVILNVEEWRIENAMPRTVLSPPMGQPLLPDVPNWSWHEYGMRAGFWRQFKALTDRIIPVTLALNANVCNAYPRVASAALEAGFEFMGHGFIQGPMHKLDDQADAIKRAVETIAKFSGKPPRSWESPGLTETEETIDLLRLNGIEYLADWVIDDLPQDIVTPHGTMTTIPYSVETNGYRHSRAAACAFRAILDALRRSIRSALSRRRIERADHGNFGSPLHYRCAPSDQISGSAARLCHRL